MREPRGGGDRRRRLRPRRVEPTLDSLQEAADFARDAEVDGFVSLGGGSTIDTAKVADLIVTHPAPVMDYVNPPVGEGRKPPSPLLPLLAIPTTSGTGSEATTVAVLDIPDLKVKTGISHRYLRPPRAIVDPELTRTLPREVTASAGLDVICHAAESYLARPTTAAAARDAGRAAALSGREPDRRHLVDEGPRVRRPLPRRAVADADDIEARGTMMLAATMAGIGFGTAGVHIPHACAYPIAGLKHVYHPPGYPEPPLRAARPLGDRHGPGGLPLHLRGNPERHLQVGRPPVRRPSRSRRRHPPDVLLAMMHDVGAPRGIAELGYDEADIPALVDGALKQQRLLVAQPARRTEAHDLEQIFRASMANW